MNKYIVSVKIKNKKPFGGGFVIEAVYECKKEVASKSAAIREAREIGKAGLFSVTKNKHALYAPYYFEIEVLDAAGEVVNRVSTYGTDYDQIKANADECTTDVAVAELLARGFATEAAKQAEQAEQLEENNERAITIAEIKAALKQLRSEISMLEMDDEAPELNDAWNGIHDAVLALTKLEQKDAEANKVELINCCNYFHVTGQNRLTEALEAGKTICIYIDCIGITRTQYERALYVDWLEEYYGNRLECLKGKGIAGDDAYRLKADE